MRSAAPFSRRKVLIAGVTALACSSRWSAALAALAPTPGQTEGPFYPKVLPLERDADLTMLKNLGVETELGKYGEVPVYDTGTFETNVPGIYVAGHFTNQRHIKGAIDAGKTLVPRLAEELAKVG